jgi:hypothetical protein
MVDFDRLNRETSAYKQKETNVYNTNIGIRLPQSNPYSATYTQDEIRRLKALGLRP